MIRRKYKECEARWGRRREHIWVVWCFVYNWRKSFLSQTLGQELLHCPLTALLAAQERAWLICWDKCVVRVQCGGSTGWWVWWWWFSLSELTQLSDVCCWPLLPGGSATARPQSAASDGVRTTEISCQDHHHPQWAPLRSITSPVIGKRKGENNPARNAKNVRSLCAGERQLDFWGRVSKTFQWY